MELITLENESVDFVYLWVDGSDAIFRENYKDAITSELPTTLRYNEASRLFRDNGELRYSLRSVEEFAPWVRKIHIVTNGQIPPWLNTNHPKISVVTHEQIFRDQGNLPTFNSNAIELQLYRIPGLSKQFVYLNDDIFLGREIKPSTFWGPASGQKYFFENTPLNTDPNASLIHDKAYAYTQYVTDNNWGAKASRKLPAHSPQLYQKDILQTLETLIPKEFGETLSHKFRTEKDLVMRIIYFSYLFESPEQGDKHIPVILENFSKHYYFLMLNPPILRRVKEFFKLHKLKSTFFCINDDLDNASYFHPLLLVFRLFLVNYFSRPSSFEVPDRKSFRYL